jgi:hypothetical protein
MKTKDHINLFIRILLNPSSGWESSNSEEAISFRDLVSPYFIITLVALFISRLVGKTLSYLSVTDFKYIVLYSLVNMVIDFLFFFIAVLAINTLLPYFKLAKSKSRVAVLTYVSLIPFYAGVIFINLFPSLFLLGLISLYSFFVLYWGIVNSLKPEKKDVNVFFTIVSLLFVGLYLILNFMLVYPFFDFIF